MIKIDHISHQYDKQTVLHDLSFQVNYGEITCILGGSGSGKTTLLRSIVGLEIPKLGSIVINNKLCTDNGRLIIPIHNRNIGFIFQDLALWPHFTVYKNIAFGLENRKADNIKSKVYDILRFFGIDEHSDKYPHQLSGGQKQLVAIARSVVLQPKILLMDEPLANLDVKLKRKILGYMTRLKDEFDLTIIYVTHDHKEAFAIADNILVLNQGMIEDYGKVTDIKMSKNDFVKDFLEF